MPAAPRDRSARRQLFSYFLLWAAGLSLALTPACRPSPQRPPLGMGADRLEDYLRVGVSPSREAAALQAYLAQSGFEVEQRIESEGWTALGLVRHRDGQRKIRIVSTRGLVASLDSHESDDFTLRHGAVRLLPAGPGGLDLDHDGAPELLVARELDGRDCLSLIRVHADGHAESVVIEADRIMPDACANAVVDEDGDGISELSVILTWPRLAWEGQMPELTLPLHASEGGWRALPPTVDAQSRWRQERLARLESARSGVDLASAQRAAVELSALANIAGASRAAQVQHYDRALRGWVLSPRAATHIRWVRQWIYRGWSAP